MLEPLTGLSSPPPSIPTLSPLPPPTSPITLTPPLRSTSAKSFLIENGDCRLVPPPPPPPPPDHDDECGPFRLTSVPLCCMWSSFASLKDWRMSFGVSWFLLPLLPPPSSFPKRLPKLTREERKVICTCTRNRSNNNGKRGVCCG